MTVLRKVYVTDEITGKTVGIRALEPSAPQGAMNIHDLDNHRVSLIEPFLFYSGTIQKLSAPATAEDTSIIVTNGAAFSVSDKIKLTENGGSTSYETGFFVINNIATNTLTLDRPIDNTYTTNADVEIVEDNMNVIGSLGSPILYELKPPPSGDMSQWHIDRVLLTATDAVAMDDGKFVSIAALTNGLTMRENKSVGFHTITNWKTNEDMRRTFYDLTYTSKAPAGQNGLVGRFSNKLFDVIYALDGALNDTLEILIQDDLSDLTTFKVMAEGHFAAL